MKFLLPLILMQFLCVKCFPWSDCDGDDLVCEELLPVRPELSDAIAYEDGEAMAYGFEGSNTTHGILAFRNEIEAGGSQRCQDGINAGFSIHGGEGDGFSLLLSTDVFNQSVLHFNFVFTSFSGPTDSEAFEVLFEESGVADIMPPLELRMIPDTVLEGNTYLDVLLIKAPEAIESGRISAFYYSKRDGLLRVERIDQSAFLRID